MVTADDSFGLGVTIVAFGLLDALLHAVERIEPVGEASSVSVEVAARRIGIGQTLAYSLCRRSWRAGPTGCVACGWAVACWCRCG